MGRGASSLRVAGARAEREHPIPHFFFAVVVVVDDVGFQSSHPLPLSTRPAAGDLSEASSKRRKQEKHHKDPAKSTSNRNPHLYEAGTHPFLNDVVGDKAML